METRPTGYLGSVDISHQIHLETIWENCYQNPQNVGDGSPYRGSEAPPTRTCNQWHNYEPGPDESRNYIVGTGGPYPYDWVLITES